MKQKLLKLFLVLLVFGFAQPVFAESSIQKKYGMRSGVLLYKYEGAQRGEEYVYFEEWGMKESRFIRLEQTVHGVDVKKQQAIYFLGNDIYSVDFQAEEVRHIYNTPLEHDRKIAKDGDLFKVMEKKFLDEGQMKLGQEEVLGKTCQVYAKMQEGFRQCLWKGILMQQRYMTLFGKAEKELVWMKEDYVPNPNKFSLPYSYDIVEGPRLNEKGEVVPS